VATSRFEGLPFTLLEALSTGLPLVLSDIAPHRELAAEADGPGVRIAGEPASAWADAVAAVAGDLTTASKDARERAEHHSLEAMVEQTLAVYAEAMA
jgi:glycosyltransferase involved in cell wall biosynthesis